MKRFLNIRLLLVIGIVLLAIFLLRIVSLRMQTTAGLPQVTIKAELDERFITEQEVLMALRRHSGNTLTGDDLTDLDLADAERGLVLDPFISKANVYLGTDGQLSITVWQREPLVRLHASTDVAFYLDVEGKPMPFSRHFTARVPVVTGALPKMKRVGETVWSAADSAILADVFLLASTIKNDDLLHKQVEQIRRKKNAEYILAPKIGDHTIIVGRTDHLEDKFYKLNTFYKEAINTVGWSTYKSFDLRYKDQVVAKKRE